MSAQYKPYKKGEGGYRPGFNAKGFKTRTDAEANPRVTTERGMRRWQHANKVHTHEWVKYSPAPSTSYHSARVDNESRYYCKRVNRGRPTGGGNGAKRGGGPRAGCGCTCRNPK